LDQLDGAAIPACASHLREITNLRCAIETEFGLWKIDLNFSAVLQSFPRVGKSWRNAQFAREDVYSAERQHAEPRSLEAIRRVTDSIKDFVHCAITPGGDDRIKTFVDCLSGERPRRACRDGRFTSALAGNLRELFTEAPCLITARGGIKDDAYLHRAIEKGTESIRLRVSLEGLRLL